MRRFIVIFCCLVLTGSVGFSQRIAYVDVDYIVQRMPAYKSAMIQLEAFVKQWKADLRSKQQALEHLYQTYEAEKPLLTPAMRKQREEKIRTKEQELFQLKERFFGEAGLLAKKQAELLKPIQDQIYRAIQQLANEEALDMVFDKSATPGLIFTNAKYDRTPEIMDILGITDTEGNTSDKKSKEASGRSGNDKRPRKAPMKLFQGE